MTVTTWTGTWPLRWGWSSVVGLSPPPGRCDTASRSTGSELSHVVGHPLVSQRTLGGGPPPTPGARNTTFHARVRTDAWGSPCGQEEATLTSAGKDGLARAPLPLRQGPCAFAVAPGQGPGARSRTRARGRGPRGAPASVGGASRAGRQGQSGALWGRGGSALSPP